MNNVQTRLNTAKTKSSKAIRELRQKAADAALRWVMSHQGRVAAFRRSVKDTPIEKAVDALLQLIRTEAKPARKSPARRAGAKKKAAARRA